MFEGKLKTWSDVGLIDAETAARIREWEAKNRKPIGLWAMIGLGALAIGLGLVSVVAANWDVIPGEFRLAIHLALLIGVAGLAWWQQSRPGGINAHFNDALLFVFGALGLTFFGHVGQVYQTTSPLWQPFALWLLLFSPLFLGFGRGWLAAAAWMAALCFTATQHWEWYLDAIDGTTRPVPLPIAAYMGALTSIPAIVAAASAWLRGRSGRPDFWRRLEQISIILALGWFSFAAMARMIGGSENWPFLVVAIQSGLLLAAAAIVRWARPTPSGLSTAAILAAAAIVNVLAPAIGESALGAGLLFMLLWGAAAGAALHAGWRIAFQIAVGVLALRLIVLSFELASDLLGSGLGLILAGLATLGIAWGAVRISKTYAPREGAA